MAHSPVFDTMHPAGKLPPTLTPTGHFAGKPTLPISRAVTLIGSRKHARLQLISSTVSHNHALIVNADSGPYVRDLASREHTLVNGVEVKEGALNDGDEIQIGRFTFRFNASPQTQPKVAIRDIRPAPLGHLEVDDGRAPARFDGNKSVLIGRRADCDVHLTQDSVSTAHAIIFEMDGRRYLRDLASRTGTFLNGKQIHQAELNPGDEVSIGGTSMRYAAEEGAAAEEAFAPAVADLGAHEEDWADFEAPAAEAGTAAAAEEDAPIEVEGLEPADDDGAIELEPAPAAAAPVAPARPAQPAAPARRAAAASPAAEEEQAELTPEDLAMSKDLADLDLAAPADAAAASRGDLTAEHLDLDVDAPNQVSVDDLLDIDALSADEAEAPVEPAPDAPDESAREAPAAGEDVEPSAAQEMARFQGQGPAASLHIAAPIDSEAPAGGEFGGAMAVEHVDLVDEALGLEPESAAAAQPPAPAVPSQFQPGASQLDLPPLEQIEARDEMEADEAFPGEPALAGESAGGPEFEPPAEVELESEGTDEPRPLIAPLADDDRAAPMAEPISIAPPQAPASSTGTPTARVDQWALQAQEARADDASADLAPDETFDTIEARKAPPAAFDFDGLEAEAVDQPPSRQDDLNVSPQLGEIAHGAPPAPPFAPLVEDDAIELEAIEEVAEPAELPAVESQAPADDEIALGEPDFALGDADVASRAPAEAVAGEPSSQPAPLELDEAGAAAAAEAGDLPRLAGDDADPLHLAESDEASAEGLPASADALADTIVSDLTPVFDLGDEPTTPAALSGESKAAGDAAPGTPGTGDAAPPAAGAPGIAGTAGAVVGAIAGAVAGTAAAVSGAAAPEQPKSKRKSRRSKRKKDAPAEPATPGTEPAGAGVADLSDTGERSAESPAGEPPAGEVPDAEVPLPELALGEAPTADEPPVDEIPISLPPLGEAPLGEAPLSAATPTESAMPLELEADALTTAPTDAAADDVEVLDHTDATLESALPMTEETAAGAPARDSLAQIDEVELTDTGFGRALDELAADSKPIVETDAPAQRGDQPASAEATDVEAWQEAPPLPEARFTRLDEPPRPLDEDSALDLLAAPPAAGTGAGTGGTGGTGTAAPRADEPTIEIEDIVDSALTGDAPKPLLASDASTMAEQASSSRLFDLPPTTAAAAPAPPRAPELPAASEVELTIEPPDEPESIEAIEEEPPADLSAATAGHDIDLDEETPGLPPPSRYAPGASQLELEPIEEMPGSSPSAPTPLEARAGDALEFEPAAQAPAMPVMPAAPAAPTGNAPAPTQPGADDQARGEAPPMPPGVAPFNWGANQEHFLGGMPLKLGGTAQSTPARPLPPPRPAARQPLTDDSISPTGPALANRPMAARPQPAQKPAPRRTGGTLGGKPAPFAGSDARSISTGFDGLAMPPVREADVFAPMPGSMTAGFGPGVIGDVFAGGSQRTLPTPQPLPGAGAGGIPPAGVGRPQPRRASKAEPTGDTWSSMTSATSHAPDADPASAPALPSRAPGGQRPPAAPSEHADQPARRKKRRWFGLRLFLMLLALPAAVAAAAGAYYLMPNTASVRGALKFVNFDRLPQRDRVELAQQQQRLLGDESVRSAARNKLSSLDPRLDAGFLGGGVAWARISTDARMDMESGTLAIPCAGAAGDADQTRMFALLQAMYDANAPTIQESNKIKSALETLTRERAEQTRRLDALKQQIEQLGTAAQSAPDVAERSKVEAEVKRLKSAWDEAIVAVQERSAQLKALEQASATPAATAPQPAPTTAEVVVQVPATAADSDADLAAMQGELKQLTDRIAAIQAGRAGGAGALKEQFDAAVATYDRQLVDALSAAKLNSPFEAYVDNAKAVIDQVREQTIAYFKRQDARYAKLAETQANLNEKQLARRAEVYKRDPELVQLMDQKDIKARQYNAAVAQNLSTEAAEIKTELNFLDSMITARQTKVADDTFFNDAIEQLQRIAEATQKQIDDDRARTARELDTLQAGLARSRPEALAPEQEKHAQRLEKSLAAVGAARQQYTEAIAAASRQADDELKTLQASASALLSKVQSRKAELIEAEKKLADANTAAPAQPRSAAAVGGAAADGAAVDAGADNGAGRRQAIEEKSAELAAAQERHDKAKADYLAANTKLAALGEQVKAARAAGEQRDRLMAHRDTLQSDLSQKILHYEAKKNEAALLAYPEIPAPTDVTAQGAPDERPKYALISFGAVAALFVLGIMLTGGGSAREPEASLPGPGDDASFAFSADSDAERDDALPHEPHAEPSERARPLQV